MAEQDAPGAGLDEDARRRVVDQARHSTELEGGRTDPAARALQERYVAGEISADELVEQTRRLVQRGG